jgi:hypothetical protein
MRNQKHLYLGKAAGTSVWTHWDADDKHEKVCPMVRDNTPTGKFLRLAWQRALTAISMA